ncbi:MAG: hypothetical protein K5837_00555 [Candidatus Saccharibacteria bacterium]|nr:hypothetical protein [Candidatus Saccharibacteria bacterium]
MIKNSENKFTFKNYLKYLRKYWVLIVVFAVIGLIGSYIYISNSKVTYSANLKVMVYNAEVDQGAAVSPYVQFKEILTSDILIEERIGLKDIASHIEVKESNRGVFTITNTESDADTAVENIKKISENIRSLVDGVYSDADKYEITILQIDQQAAASTNLKKDIFMGIVATFAMVALAAVIIFIKFDFSTEK